MHEYDRVKLFRDISIYRSLSFSRSRFIFLFVLVWTKKCKQNWCLYSIYYFFFFKWIVSNARYDAAIRVSFTRLKIENSSTNNQQKFNLYYHFLFSAVIIYILIMIAANWKLVLGNLLLFWYSLTKIQCSNPTKFNEIIN